MKTFKKIGKIAVDVLVVLVFMISVVLVIANITADRENGGQPNVFGYVISSVQSESMSGTFEKGALVIGKIPTNDTVIVKDDIISFRQKVNGKNIINTHRVVDVNDSGAITVYQTQGDNRKICPAPDSEWKTINDITAVYKFHIPGVGGFIDFLKKPLGFVICLVLPMLVFIGWQVYKLISLYIQSKKHQIIEEAKDNVSDEAKDAIIREYLAKMQAENSSAPKITEEVSEAPTEAPTDAPAEEPSEEITESNNESNASNGDDNK